MRHKAQKPIGFGRYASGTNSTKSVKSLSIGKDYGVLVVVIG